MNSLLFFSSEVLSISCSFFYKSKMKVYKKKNNKKKIKNSIPVLTEIITMSLAKVGIALNITSTPVFYVRLILSPSFSVALFLASFLSLFCCLIFYILQLTLDFRLPDTILMGLSLSLVFVLCYLPLPAFFLKWSFIL